MACLWYRNWLEIPDPRLLRVKGQKGIGGKSSPVFEVSVESRSNSIWTLGLKAKCIEGEKFFPCPREKQSIKLAVWGQES